VISSLPKLPSIAINRESYRGSHETSFARCRFRARRGGDSTCSPYTMIAIIMIAITAIAEAVIADGVIAETASAPSADPHSSCFKMRSPWRTIVTLPIPIERI